MRQLHGKFTTPTQAFFFAESAGAKVERNQVSNVWFAELGRYRYTLQYDERNAVYYWLTFEPDTRTTATTWDRSSQAHESVDHDVVALTLGLGGPTAQVSKIPETYGEGFLVRVWPPGGTHEQGGNNLTSLSLVLKFDADGQPTLESFHLDSPTP